MSALNSPQQIVITSRDRANAVQPAASSTSVVQITLPRSVQGVKRVQVLSAQVPFTWNVFNPGNNTLFLQFFDATGWNSETFAFGLPTKIATPTIDELAAVVANALQGTYGAAVPVSQVAISGAGLGSNGSFAAFALGVTAAYDPVAARLNFAAVQAGTATVTAATWKILSPWEASVIQQNYPSVNSGLPSPSLQQDYLRLANGVLGFQSVATPVAVGGTTAYLVGDAMPQMWDTAIQLTMDVVNDAISSRDTPAFAALIPVGTAGAAWSGVINYTNPPGGASVGTSRSEFYSIRAALLDLSGNPLDLQGADWSALLQLFY